MVLPVIVKLPLTDSDEAVTAPSVAEAPDAFILVVTLMVGTVINEFADTTEL